MKNLRKILSLVIVAMLLVSIAVIPASAASRCPACGGSNITISKYTYGSWYNTVKVECSHYDSGKDQLQSRTKYANYFCSSCGTTFTESAGSQTRVICNGYDA